MVCPFEEEHLRVEAPAVDRRAEAVPVNRVKFGPGPAMLVAKVFNLIGFVIEWKSGPTDVANSGWYFSVDGLSLNLQGYLRGW